MHMEVSSTNSKVITHIHAYGSQQHQHYACIWQSAAPSVRSLLIIPMTLHISLLMADTESSGRTCTVLMADTESSGHSCTVLMADTESSGHTCTALMADTESSGHSCTVLMADTKSSGHTYTVRMADNYAINHQQLLTIKPWLTE